MNRNDVIDVLSVVAGASRRTIGEVDVDVWQGVIGDLPRDAALKAVRDHLRESPGVWLEPGHVYQRAKAALRDIAEKEHTKQLVDEGRVARQAALDAANRERIEELTAQVGQPYPRPSKTHGINPLSVVCPYEACRSKAGYVCVNSALGMKPRREPHPSRVDAAKAAARRAS